MKIELRRLNKAVHFECLNEEGLRVETDGSPDVGGEGKGVRPMQMLLMSLAACSSIDVVHLLTKMRQAPDDIRVEVEGERVTGKIPGVFRKIHLTYFITGDLKQDSVEKAIGMSVEKYCSVAAMLSSTAAITWSLQMISPAQS
jgi:putative redox protein